MRPGQKRNCARHLRRSMTDAELRLWFHLRNRALMGCKFRRQHPIGPYIADFACIERGLIVETDGGQHADSGADRVRTRFLAFRGYRVLRFWNNDVLARTDAVLEQIHAAVARDAVSLS
ncbi:endonuclease domain-containing protein [Lysobacter sp. CCNWLW3]|uniref:endonuclease domain-containing protein n=1 Tax=unclassified Lysobacter TaxID=2635362 RepID=UPI002FD6AEF8